MKESDILFQQGMELLKTGQYKKAEEVFNKAKNIIEKSV